MDKLLDILTVITSTLIILLFITPIIFIWSDISFEICIKTYCTNVLLVFLLYIIREAVKRTIEDE